MNLQQLHAGGAHDTADNALQLYILAHPSRFPKYGRMLSKLHTCCKNLIIRLSMLNQFTLYLKP